MVVGWRNGDGNGSQTYRRATGILVECDWNVSQSYQRATGILVEGSECKGNPFRRHQRVVGMVVGGMRSLSAAHVGAWNVSRRAKIPVGGTRAGSECASAPSSAPYRERRRLSVEHRLRSGRRNLLHKRSQQEPYPLGTPSDLHLMNFDLFFFSNTPLAKQFIGADGSHRQTLGGCTDR